MTETDTRARLTRALDRWRRARSDESRARGSLAVRDAFEAATGGIFSADSWSEVVGYIKDTSGRRGWLEVYGRDGDLSADVYGTGYVGGCDAGQVEDVRSGAAFIDAIVGLGVALPGLEVPRER